MIKVKDLASMLITGAFANTAFSGEDGELKDTHKVKVANLINQGMVELYKRFKFMENELTLHVVPEVSTYYLRADRTALVSAITADKYIVANPTLDGFLNIVKVTAAFDADGNEIRLNYIRSKNSEDIVIPAIVNLGTDVLRITNVISPQVLSIVYQSYPNKINENSFSNPLAELSIPDVAIEPLVAYIAAKMFKPMGANDSTAGADKSASYEQIYELACQKIAMYGLAVQDITERETFYSNGWV